MPEVEQAPATLTVPAHAVAEVHCGLCGLLLITTWTQTGTSSQGSSILHWCAGRIPVSVRLTVHARPEREVDLDNEPEREAHDEENDDA